MKKWQNKTDLFSVAGTSRDMAIAGQIYGLSIPIMESKENCLELM